MIKQPKITCSTCKQTIKITKKPDVPRIATKPYCCRGYNIKKYELRTKPRKNGCGRQPEFRKKYLWSN